LIVYGQAGIAQIRLHKNILSKEREKSNKRIYNIVSAKPVVRRRANFVEVRVYQKKKMP